MTVFNLKIEEEDQDNKQVRERVPCDYILKLKKAVGSNTKVGALIGVSGNLIAESVREGQACKVNEVAAMGIWNRDFEQKYSYVAALVTLPPLEMELLKDQVESVNGTFTKIQ